MNIKQMWVLQLRREFEHICFSYGVRLAVPIIDVQSRIDWGIWVPELRTIIISEELIKSYSWDSVIAVLKHEMAHQLVHDVFASVEGHGPLFKQACKMLGVPKELQCSRADLPKNFRDPFHAPLMHGDDSLFRKVERLLSLAESANQFEAANAMAKVQELLAKYNVERPSSDFTYVIVNPKKLRLDRTIQLVAAILHEFYFVQIIYSELYDAELLKSFKTIELHGRLPNVQMAEHVYYFLMQQLQSLWKRHQKVHQGRRSLDRRSYQMGVLNGFKKNLAELQKQNKVQNQESALVVIEHDKELNGAVLERFPRIRQSRASGIRVHGEDYMQGQSDGQKIVLQKPIKENKSQARYLLT